MEHFTNSSSVFESKEQRLWPDSKVAGGIRRWHVLVPEGFPDLSLHLHSVLLSMVVSGSLSLSLLLSPFPGFCLIGRVGPIEVRVIIIVTVLVAYRGDIVCECKVAFSTTTEITGQRKCNLPGLLARLSALTPSLPSSCCLCRKAPAPSKRAASRDPVQIKIQSVMLMKKESCELTECL